MRIFIDMDNTLVDFSSGIRKLPEKTQIEYEGDLDNVPGIFGLMDPIQGAVEAYRVLVKRRHDVFILSTAPWNNPSAWSDKLIWVKEHLGDMARKRLILSHHKYLMRGDILIDDRRKRGAGAFSGLHLQYGAGELTDWDAVLQAVADVT